MPPGPPRLRRGRWPRPDVASAAVLATAATVPSSGLAAGAAGQAVPDVGERTLSSEGFGQAASVETALEPPAAAVLGLEVARCASPLGEHANCKHMGGGSANFTLPTCEAAMTQFGGDTINFHPVPGACWVKLCGSKDLQYSSQYGEWEVYSKFCRPCSRPLTWCMQANATFDETQDCDGDGILDPACSDPFGGAGFIGSASGCADFWGQRACGTAAAGSAAAAASGEQSLFAKFKSEFKALEEKELAHLGPLGNLLKEAEAEEQKIKSKLGPVEKGIAEVYEGLNEPNYNAPPRLGGNDESTVNRMVAYIVSFVVLGTAVAGYVDVVYAPRALEGRPKLWAMTMLGSSYLLLIPGLTNVLLSFSIIVNVIGHRIRVHPGADQPSCTESTPGMIQLLYDTGGTTGAYLIILFAMVVPAMELVFIVIGELCRFRVSGACAKCFRMAIIWVQHRSKWASPDMFAYTLLVYLIRTLDHETLILTRAQLDVGFSCFCAFCVCATVSALGFPLPEVDDDEEESLLVPAPEPLVLRVLGRWGVAIVATVLSTTCGYMLHRGSTETVMAFRINERPLYQPVGPLPTAAKAAVDMLDIPNMLKSDVNLWQCINAMVGWAREGEATSALASIMWGVFVLGLTVLNIIMLTLASWRLCLSGGEAGNPASLDTRLPAWLTDSMCPFMAVSKILKKLAMLDVAVVGIYLVTYCMAIYKNIGVLVSCREGVVSLFIAEVLHNVLYLFVAAAADVPEPKSVKQPHLAYVQTLMEDSAVEGDLPEACTSNCFGRTRDDCLGRDCSGASFFGGPPSARQQASRLGFR